MPTEGGFYVDVTVQLNEQLRWEPGLRMHSFASRHQVTFEPRLRMAWQPGGEVGKHVFSAAWGIYHQQIIGLYNARDVTDTFVTWAPSPEEATAVPKAMHVLAGWRGQVRPWLSLGLEAYYKDLSHLAFAEYSEMFGAGVTVDPVEGEAEGLEFKLEITRPGFFGSISYGLARVSYERQVERTIFRPVDDGNGVRFVPETQTETEHFPPPHDRRHQINALARLARGPYALSVRWQFGSGLPYTQAEGFYNLIPIDGPEDTGFQTHPGAPVLVTDRDLYGERLPAYHRLDLTLERRFTVRGMQATLQAALINVYDRANIFDYDLFARRRIDQLPLIPSLGLKVEVR